MYKNKKFLAIIPARSGSKGLKDKNVKELVDKPLIAYTIEAAIKSYVFDDIVVSTDSENYADVSKQYGASVPFLRPEELSNDYATTNDVLTYVLEELKKQEKTYDYFILLQPTSPLRDENDILEAVNLLFDKNANSVVSVCEVDHSSMINIFLEEDLSMDNFMKNIDKVRRQDMAKEYRVNGAIYICNIEYFMEYKNFYNNNSYAYIMDKRKSIDIDDRYDFKMVELMIKDSGRINIKNDSIK